MPNDIEYPQSDAQLGTSFHAGGEFDVQFTGITIFARLVGNMGGTKDSSPFDPHGDTTGFWDVTFTDCPMDQNPYTLKMIIDNNGNQTEADTVSNITIRSDAGGRFTVQVSSFNSETQYHAAES
jgi:hypothetical protein